MQWVYKARRMAHWSNTYAVLTLVGAATCVTRKKDTLLRRHLICLAAILAMVILSAAPSMAEVSARVVPQPELERGFNEMYNLDFEGAHSTFRFYQKLNPDDPLGYVANAAAYLFSEFNRL